MDKNISSVDYLKTLDVKPSWFGLGFIQLRLNETERMHFWHPALLPDDPALVEEWHDHRYDFSSRVLAGSIINEMAEFQTDRDPTEHEMFEVCCAGGGSDWKSWGYVNHRSTFETVAGHEYWLNRNVFHRVRMSGGGKTATLQTRGFEHKQKARVIRKMGVQPANPFHSTMAVDRMWEIIDDILPKQPGYHIEFIEKGKLGEASKIREEVDELLDAVAQDTRVMELVELSDIMGAVEAFLKKRHPSYTVDDLQKMSAITQRAFKSGQR